jgi:hypothetical protein
VSISDSIDSAGTANLAFLEELFGRYQADPASVSPDWRAYFEGVQKAWPAAGNGHVAPAPAAVPAAATAPRRAALTPSPKLVAPDGIATAHAVAIANGAVELAAAPAGEEERTRAAGASRSAAPIKAVVRSGRMGTPRDGGRTCTSSSVLTRCLDAANPNQFPARLHGARSSLREPARIGR